MIYDDKDRSDHEQFYAARAAAEQADEEMDEARRWEYGGHHPECSWVFDPADGCSCGAIDEEAALGLDHDDEGDAQRC
jgi:hypothetical protein